MTRRSSKLALALFCIGALALTGCRSHPLANDDSLDSIVQLATETQPLPVPAIAEPVSEPEEILPAPAASAGGLSLVQAVELGLAQNPDLTTLRQGEGVSVGQLGVAQTYPFNPFVQLQVTPSRNPDGSTAETAHYVLLMQTLQLAHQRKHRTEAAQAALSSVRWNIVQAEMVNVATTQRLYFAALYQRSIRDLLRANAQWNDQLLDISEKQFAAGQIAAADVAIVRLDHQSTRQQAQLFEATFQTAVLDLRRHLNLPLGEPLELAEDLAAWRWSTVSGQSLAWLASCAELDPLTAHNDALLAGLLASGRPDVLAAQADLATAAANRRLAGASRVPDLQIGPYYQRGDSGVVGWGFRAQADIPVLNSGRPLVRQRVAEMTQRQAAWEQLQQRATREAEAAIDRYHRALQLVADSPEIRGGAIPAELEKLEDQFRAGEVDAVRVITARTSLLQARRAQLDMLNELAQAAAALSAVTGLPPQALVATN